MSPDFRTFLQSQFVQLHDSLTRIRRKHSDDANQTFTSDDGIFQRPESGPISTPITRTKNRKMSKESRFIEENGQHHHFLAPRIPKPSLYQKLRSSLLIRCKTGNSVNRRATPLDTEWEQWIQYIPGMDNSREIVVQRYGDIEATLGFGAHGVVLLSHKVMQVQPDVDKFYALKLFRRGLSQTEADYHRRVHSEFLIVSQLDHHNIARIFDLLPMGDNVLCQCMEFYDGGDLFSLIHTYGPLEEAEANCFFKQLIQGVLYLHEMGVAHRDLKPENILLSKRDCLKISDFGNAECFRLRWESQVHMSTRRCGSTPYTSPEQYLGGEFDPRLVDIWAAALVYVAMRTVQTPWKVATYNDELFRESIEHCQSGQQRAIKGILPDQGQRVILAMLTVEPTRRPGAAEVFNTSWVRAIECCQRGGYR